MKTLLLLFLFPLCVMGANPYTYRIDTASVNVPATFPVSPQLTGPANSIATVQVDNQTSSEIEINCSRTTVPGTNSVDSFYVAGGTSWETPSPLPLIQTPLSKVCWFRSVSGVISVGIIRVTAWGY